MKRCVCVILCLLLLGGQIFAAEGDSLEERVSDFLRINGLNEENFSFSYYNTETAATVSYNEGAFFPVGEVWRLPLHMYYYEQEALGIFKAPPDDPHWELTINGMNLEECRYQSIIGGDEIVSLAMRDYWGDMQQYQLLINEAFGHLPNKELTEEYLSSPVYNAEFLMNCLKEISLHPEQFADMMQNFALVQSNEGFGAYSYPYHLVHVSGKSSMFYCDVGEVVGPQTYLLVAFVSESAGGADVLAALNNLICAYLEEGIYIGTGEAQEGHTRSDSDFVLSSDRPANRLEALIWIGIALGGLAIISLIIGGISWLSHRKADREKYREV